MDTWAHAQMDILTKYRHKFKGLDNGQTFIPIDLQTYNIQTYRQIDGQRINIQTDKKYNREINELRGKQTDNQTDGEINSQTQRRTYRRSGKIYICQNQKFITILTIKLNF